MEIGLVKIFLSLTHQHSHSRAGIVKFVSEYIFHFKKKTKTVGNLTWYYDIICEFALCTFNLLDQVAV